MGEGKTEKKNQDIGKSKKKNKITRTGKKKFFLFDICCYNYLAKIILNIVFAVVVVVINFLKKKTSKTI